MRRRAFICGALLSALAAGRARAAGRSHDNADFGIDLPAGYLGPVEHVAGASVSRGFRKPYAGTALSTVILVTVHNYGPSFAKQVPGERAAATREALDDIVASLARNRSGFRKTEARSVTIAGHSGLAVAWGGAAQGVDFEGVVYCVPAGPRTFAVQIQNPAERSGERMSEAIRAVERMRIARVGDARHSPPAPK